MYLYQCRDPKKHNVRTPPIAGILYLETGNKDCSSFVWAANVNRLNTSNNISFLKKKDSIF